VSENNDSPRLDVVDLDPDPMVAFESWFTAA
jgi:DNA primase